MQKTIMVALLIFSFFFTAMVSGQSEDEKLSSAVAELSNLMDIELSTAAKTSEKIREIPASVVLITRKDIEKAGYQSFTEILSHIPGLFVAHDGADYSIGVRGFYSVPQRNVMILLNGMPLNGVVAEEYDPVIYDFSVDAIDRIEVIRGPMSVIYGSGAFYGIINIISDESVSDELTSSFSISYGNDATKRLFLGTEGKLGDLNYSLNMSEMQKDGIDISFQELAGEPISPFFNAQERTKDFYKASRRFVDFSGSYKDFRAKVYFMEGTRGIQFQFPSHLPNSNLDRRLHIMLEHSFDFSDRFNLTSRISFNDNDKDTSFRFFHNNFKGFQEMPGKSWSIDLESFWDMSSTFRLSAGLSQTTVYQAQSNYDLPELGLFNIRQTIDDDMVTRSAYVQAKWFLSNHLLMVGGVRFEQIQEYQMSRREDYPFSNGQEFYKKAIYNDEDLKVVPRMALIWEANADNVLKLLVGRAVNYPSIFSTFQTQLNSDYPSLEPELVDTYELNYVSSISQHFSLSASVFWNNLSNLITRIAYFDDQGNYISSEGNEGELDTIGAEISVKLSADSWDISYSYSYQDTEDKTVGRDGITPGFSPQSLSSFNLSYSPSEDMIIALNGYMVDEMLTEWNTNHLTEAGGIGTRTGENVEPFFNISANVRINNLLGEGTHVNLHLINLWDTEIYYPTTANNTWLMHGFPGPARSAFLSFGIDF